jgi:hypothetical protein
MAWLAAIESSVLLGGALGFLVWWWALGRGTGL